MTQFKIVSNKVEGGTTPAMIEAAESKLGFMEIPEDSIVKLTVEPFDNSVRTSASFTDTFNHHYKLTAHGETFYSSLDELKDMIKRAIRKHHEKTREGKRVHEDFVALEPMVSREKVIITSPMSVDSAIAEMESLGHDWYLFQNEDTAETNMIYRRFEGDYGIVVIK